jgi:hypothetical protein
MAYRDKMERMFRLWHIRDYKKRKAKRAKNGQCVTKAK